MPGPNPNTSKFRVIQGGRSSSAASIAKGWKEEPAAQAPAVEKPIPLLEVRKKNRRRLAEGYCANHPPPQGNGWKHNPQMEEMGRECRIQSISQQPETLRDFAEEYMIGNPWSVKHNAKSLRNYEDALGRSVAAEKLAHIASDCEIYGKESSVAALRALVVEAIEHASDDARKALDSLGFDPETVPRLELVALTAGRIRLWFDARLREALDMLCKRLEKGF